MCTCLCKFDESAVGIATMDGGQGLKSERTVLRFSCILASMTHDIDRMPSSECFHCVIITALSLSDS